VNFNFFNLIVGSIEFNLEALDGRQGFVPTLPSFLRTECARSNPCCKRSLRSVAPQGKMQLGTRRREAAARALTIRALHGALIRSGDLDTGFYERAIIVGLGLASRRLCLSSRDLT
jgi:hypothetical protein